MRTLQSLIAEAAAGRKASLAVLLASPDGKQGAGAFLSFHDALSDEQPNFERLTDAEFQALSTEALALCGGERKATTVPVEALPEGAAVAVIRWTNGGVGVWHDGQQFGASLLYKLHPHQDVTAQTAPNASVVLSHEPGDGKAGVFSFRAECQDDVDQLWAGLRSSGIAIIERERRDGGGLPDVEIEFVAGIRDIEVIRAVVRAVPDGHVILQTLRQCRLAENSLKRDTSLT